MTATTLPTWQLAARQGSRDIAPATLGVLPFAVVIGVASVRADIGGAPAWAASFLLCAGTAQLTLVELLADGTTPVTIVLTTVVINGRFAVYSAALARWFATERLRTRLLLAFPLVDQLFLVCNRRFDDARGGPTDRADGRRAYFVGAAATLVGAWSLTQAAAMAFAGSLPGVDHLRLASPLVFVGMLATGVRRRPQLIAAMTGALGVVVATGLPHHLDLVAGIAAGTAGGVLADRRAR